MTEKVVLAYSGGLDTSVAIGWIAERTGADVVALAGDVGQVDDTEPVPACRPPVVGARELAGAAGEPPLLERGHAVAQVGRR